MALLVPGVLCTPRKSEGFPDTFLQLVFQGFGALCLFFSRASLALFNFDGGGNEGCVFSTLRHRAEIFH